MPDRVIPNCDGTVTVSVDYSHWRSQLRRTAIRLLENEHAWRYRENTDSFELVDTDLEGLESMDQFRILGGIGLELLAKAVCLKRKIDILQLQSQAACKSHYAMFLVHADDNPWLQSMFARYKVHTVADLKTRSFGECIRFLHSDLQRSPVDSVPNSDEIIKSLDRWRAFNRNFDCHILHSIRAMEEYEVKLPNALNGLLTIYAGS